MRVSDEMVDKACAAYLYRTCPIMPDAMRAALEAALADVPEPLGAANFEMPEVPPPAEFPFKLTELEREFLKSARAYGDRHHGYLLNIIERAVRSAELAPTLAAPAAEPLDDQVRKLAEAWANDQSHSASSVAKELLRRCPAPARKTALELRKEILYLGIHGDSTGGILALDELVRRAEAGEP